MTKLSRKERRKQGGFVPQYNGKAPITFTEYLADFKTDITGKSLVPRRLRTSPLNKAEVSE